MKKPKDFIGLIGKHVYVTTYEPVEGMKEFEGKLLHLTSESILTIRIGWQHTSTQISL